MIDEKKLEERLVALEAAKSWSPRVVSRLEMLMRSGTDEELYRINPIAFAIEKSIVEAEAIDLSSTPAWPGYSTWTGCSFARCAPTSWRASEAAQTAHAFPQQPLPKRLRRCARRLYHGSVHRFARFHNPDVLSAWDYAFFLQNDAGRRVARWRAVERVDQRHDEGA